MFIKQCVITQNLATDVAQYVDGKVRDDEGEVSSYMIVLAMLVGVAAFAKTSLDGPLRQKVTDVVTGLTN